jgi:hypothetical protein
VVRIACKSVPQSALLRRRAEFLHRQRQHQMRIENPGHRHPHRGNPHHDQRIGPRRQPEATIFLADRRPKQSKLLHLFDDMRGIAIGVVVFLHDRLQLAVHPAVDRCEQLGFVRFIQLAHREGSFRGAARQP